MRCCDCARRYRRDATLGEYDSPRCEEYDRDGYGREGYGRDYEMRRAPYRPAEPSFVERWYRKPSTAWAYDDVTTGRYMPREHAPVHAYGEASAEPSRVPPAAPPRSREQARQHYGPSERAYVPLERVYTPRAPSHARSERSPALAVYDIMRRWNLSFSGKAGKDGNAFITRIHECRRLVNIVDDDLLCCLPFFLSGIALYWFRSQCSSWTSWNDFLHAFRNRFVDPDFQQSLREELFRRTQGEVESVADFMTCVRAMAEWLVPPLPERELSASIHRNMSPRLQVVIPRDMVYSFGHLEAVATRIERSYVLSRSFRPPPLPEQSLLPDLAYRGPRSKSSKALACTVGEDHPESELYALPSPGSSKAPAKVPKKTVKISPASPSTSEANASAPVPTAVSDAITPGGSTNPFLTSDNDAALPVAEAPPPVPPRNSRPPSRCWNCQELGHTYRFCSKPMVIFCYGCGKREVTRRNCPKCSGNSPGEG